MDIFTALEPYKRYSRVIQEEHQIEGMIEHIRNAPVVAFDTETTEFSKTTRFKDIVMLGIGLATGTYSCYIPLNHITQHPQLSLEAILLVLQTELFSNPDKIKIAHNLKFDMKILHNYAIKIQEPIADTMLMTWLLNEVAPRKLEYLAKTEFGIPMLNYKEINKGSLIDANIKDVATYCRIDAKTCYLLYQKYLPLIKEECLQKAFVLEMQFIPIVAAMESVGMTIDGEKLNELGDKIGKEINCLRARILTTAGYQFNIDSTQQLQEFLYKQLKLEPEFYTNSGEPSTDVRALKALRDEHEVIQMILDYRELRKMQSTYIEGFKERLDEHNKIYGEFNQIGESEGTKTGRLSSKNPNLQNLPRDDKGNKLQFRQIFIAPKDYDMLVADYNQLEMRLIAHFSQDENLLRAYSLGIDVHTDTASIMFGVPYDEVTKEQRTISKTIGFGLSYGASPYKLSEMLEVDVDYAEELYNLYHEKYQGVTLWKVKTVSKCKENLYVQTLTGRRRRLPEILSSDKKEKSRAERQAINSVIQGSAADIVKAAMIKIYKNDELNRLGLQTISQVHDELIMLCPNQNTEKVIPIITDLMEHPFSKELSIPLKIELGVGKNWSEAKI